MCITCCPCSPRSHGTKIWTTHPDTAYREGCTENMGSEKGIHTKSQITDLTAVSAPIFGGRVSPSACSNALMGHQCCTRPFWLLGHPQKRGYKKYSNTVLGHSLVSQAVYLVVISVYIHIYNLNIYWIPHPRESTLVKGGKKFLMSKLEKSPHRGFWGHTTLKLKSTALLQKEAHFTWCWEP